MKRSHRMKTVDPQTLNEIIQRIVEAAKPDKIILFGSAARSQMEPNSDVDLLVIKRGRFHRGRLTEKIYMNLLNLSRVDRGVDIVVVTADDVEKYRGNPALVIYPAFEEGKVVYAAS